jgi:seryl-tRNA synthetase
MLLEQAILQYTLKKLVKNDLYPMNVPNIVNPEALLGTGYFLEEKKMLIGWKEIIND